MSTKPSRLALHRRKHDTLSALFRTLLHQLMTAQLRMHDLDLDGLLVGEAHSARNAETFGREDVEWGLHGRE